MIKRKIIFQGKVRIYLQGQNALIPESNNYEGQASYFVGSSISRILVKDFRQTAITAAKRALSGIDEEQFADIFNQQANARIFISEVDKENENIEIYLSPIDEDGDFPILWMGIIDDLLIPMHDLEWEILRPINMEKVAFVSILKTTTTSTAETTNQENKTPIHSLD